MDVAVAAGYLGALPQPCTHAEVCLRIVSWNVNGLRACIQKGFVDWLGGCGAAVVALQEVRASAEQAAAALEPAASWHRHIVAGQRPGYSGVGLLSRQPLCDIQTGLGQPIFDDEGRMHMARIGNLWIVNSYFPNGNGTTLPGGKRSNDRIPYKLAYYRALFDRLEPLRASGAAVLVVGDFNTAHRAIDLARPKDNVQTSGFRPEERAELDRWLEAGWVDTFRHFHPEARDRYSWWSQRFGIRARNVGWRIDLILASPGALPHLRTAEIHSDVIGSDHCPISVDVDGMGLDFPAGSC